MSKNSCIMQFYEINFVITWFLCFILFITRIKYQKLTTKPEKNRKYYRKCSNNFAADSKLLRKMLWTLYYLIESLGDLARGSIESLKWLGERTFCLVGRVYYIDVYELRSYCEHRCFWAVKTSQSIFFYTSSCPIFSEYSELISWLE